MQHPAKIIANYYSTHQILPEQTIAFMEYVLMSLCNEWIKIVMYGIFFSLLGKSALFWFVLAIMYSIRWFSGGMHCKTFWGCFGISLAVFSALVYISPILPCFPIIFSIILIIIGGISINRVPYTPPIRPIKKHRTICLLRCFYITMLIAWIIFLNLAPLPTQYVSSGFYTLFSQVIQLLIPHQERSLSS